MNANITVVISTYNRAHLLEKTIPSYIQPEVHEVIIVDDGSTDDTLNVLRKISNLYPRKIRILSSDKNIKQVKCKNIGKSEANTKWVYFGDDDSVLTENSLRNLVTTASKNNSDITAAIAVYCKNNQTPKQAENFYYSQKPVDDSLKFANLEKLHFNFSLRPQSELPMITTQACILISHQWYKTINFDERYTGNCYREETDYVLSCYRLGAKINLCPNALQINLPPEQATGGARSSNRLVYEYYSILNTYRFLSKHKEFYLKELRCFSIYTVLFSFIKNRIIAAARKILK